MHTTKRFVATLGALAAAALLSACSSDSDTPASMPLPVTPPAPATATFEVTLLNLTAGQPLSPMVALAHNDSFTLFALGQSASVALEQIAEAGNGAPLVALANDTKSVLAVAAATGGPLLPGPGNKASVTLTVPLSTLPTLRLSLASMLGNTNDGFTGVGGQSLSSLAVGATVNSTLLGYDAGTERNTESADTIPGPANTVAGARREGFSASRDDVIGTVHLHPGIVSKDDGLPSSVLTQAQRWDNPVALLSVRRTQ